MVVSSKDYEKLWFMYQSEGLPQNMSINDFCIKNGVSYTEFNKWFRSHHKSVIPIEISGKPTQENTETSVTEPAEANVSTAKKDNSRGGILVTIQTRDGLHIRKGGLDYQGLKNLVEKLEGLC